MDYIKIPIEFLEDNDLSAVDKILLWLIYYFKDSSLINKKYICKTLDISWPTYLKSVRNLNRLWYISLTWDMEIGKLSDVETYFNH